MTSFSHDWPIWVMFFLAWMIWIYRGSPQLYSMCGTKLWLWLRSWSSSLSALTRTTHRSFHHCMILCANELKLTGQCQMWYSLAPEWDGCAVTQVLSRNGWHKQLDSLSLSCPASIPLTDIWKREPRNCNKRFCENVISSEDTARFLDWAVLRIFCL